ncbi:MAG: hypothetical protein IJK68_01180, partial [Muribaculaceae bacterium]|nr:hypothetical protein [Muribaculaceae bacterium]
NLIVLTELYFLHFNPVFCLLLCKLISGQVSESSESGESGESGESMFSLKTNVTKAKAFVFCIVFCLLDKPC